MQWRGVRRCIALIVLVSFALNLVQYFVYGYWLFPSAIDRTAARFPLRIDRLPRLAATALMTSFAVMMFGALVLIVDDSVSRYRNRQSDGRKSRES